MLLPPVGVIPAAPRGAGDARISEELSSARAATAENPTAPTPAITIHFPHVPWVNVTGSAPGTSPPAIEGGASAYDPLDHETVYFGGCIENGACPSNQTWVFANGVWTNETNFADSPSARTNAAMDYDANMHAVLLYGGEGALGPLNSTWIFSNGTWTNVTYVGSGPIALEGASLAFDPQPEENGSVLYGGCVPEFIFLACSNETWVWQGWAGWVRLDTSIAPPAEGFAQMAYDPIGQYLVLFGGYGGALDVFGGTWELYSGQWWTTDTPTTPGNTSFGGMVYVPALGGILLTGGINAAFDYQNATWLFVLGGWTAESPPVAYPARESFGLSLDGTGTTPLLVGGSNGTQSFSDSWAYEFPPVVSLSFNRTSSEVGIGTTYTANLEDGTPPYNVTVSFGDGAKAYAAGTGPTLNVTHTYSAPGTYEVSVAASDSVGATAFEENLPFSVVAGPAVRATATPSAGDVGQPIAFGTTVLASGAGSLRYAWAFGDGTTGTGAAPSHSYASPGRYTVTETVRDAELASSSVSLVVTVAAEPTLSLGTFPAAPETGAVVTLFANVTGGTGPFLYTWLLDGKQESSFPAPQQTFSSAGSYSFRVWVNDSVGASVHGTLTVKVSNPPTRATGLSGAPLWFWGGIGALVVVAVGGSVLLVRRNRPRPPAR